MVGGDLASNCDSREVSAVVVGLYWTERYRACGYSGYVENECADVVVCVVTFGLVKLKE